MHKDYSESNLVSPPPRMDNKSACTGENSHLIKECNQLRSENLALSREVSHLRQVVKDHHTASAKRREKLRSHEKTPNLANNTTGHSHVPSKEGARPKLAESAAKASPLHPSAILTPGVPPKGAYDSSCCALQFA